MGPPKRHHTPDSEELYHQIEYFHTASLHVEDSNADLDAIKCAVKGAFQLTADGFSFFSRLQKANFPPSAMDRREVREINKLGNYWRVCLSLAHLSRSYRPLFASLRLELIQPFAASTAFGVRKVRHVHAEVQMLVHYEIRGRTTWPRAIGVSKEACFLCSSLIKSHGLFYVSKAHRQIYPQWTIPDLSEYRSESLDRLQKALADVRRDVGSLLKQAARNRNFRPYPLQSSTNLHKPSFPTPSVTTAHSIRSGETDIASETMKSALRHTPPALQEAELLERHSPGLRCRTPQSPASFPSKEASMPSMSLKFLTCHEILTYAKGSHCSALVTSDWLELFVCLAGHSSEDSIPQDLLQVDSILLTPVSEERVEHSFDLSQLEPGEEVTIPSHTNYHRSENADTEMSVVLAFKQKNSISIRWSWSRPR
jgi:hypothetical protein